RKLKLDPDAAVAVFKDLIKKKMIAEQPAGQGAATWGNSEDGPGLMLVLTDAGLRAIGAQPASELAIASKRTREGRRKGTRATPTRAGRQRRPQRGVEPARMTETDRTPQDGSARQMTLAGLQNNRLVQGTPSMVVALTKKDSEQYCIASAYHWRPSRPGPP